MKLNTETHFVPLINCVIDDAHGRYRSSVVNLVQPPLLHFSSYFVVNCSCDLY